MLRHKKYPGTGERLQDGPSRMSSILDEVVVFFLLLDIGQVSFCDSRVLRGSIRSGMLDATRLTLDFIFNELFSASR